MKMLKSLTLLTLALVLVACNPVAPEQTEVTPNGVEVSKIVEIEGCKMYRVDRGGLSYAIYTTICPADSGKSSSTSYRQDCGKGCNRNVEVPTSRLGGQVEKQFREPLKND
jgi:hypothetical protein